RRLLQEISGKEVKVSSGAGEVRRPSAIEVQPRLVADECCGTVISGADRDSREIVDAVVNGTTPVKREFRGHRGLGIERQANGRANIGEVQGAEQRGQAGVGRIGEKGVERIEVAAGGARIPGGVVETNTQARLKFQTAQRQAVICGNGSGVNIAAGEGAGLKDEVGVVIENALFVPKTSAEGMANFLSGSPVKRGSLAIERDIVAGPSAALGGSSKPRAPLRLGVVGDGVRIRPKQNGMRQGGIPSPPAMLEREAEAIERAADIQAFAFPDDVAASKFNFLAADSQAQTLRAVRDVEEDLVQISDILVGQAGATDAPFFEAALKLGKEANARAEMPIRVEKIALEKIPGGCFRVRAKAGVFVVFVAIANFTAEG